MQAGKNKMYVCKAFYRQFEWATHEDWVATSQYPVLICHGDDDKVTSLEGAQALLKLLLSQQDSRDASKNKVGRSPDLIPVCSKDAQSDINGLIHTPDKNRFQMVMISHAGHQLLEEQPSQIVDQMNRFLADICGLIIAH